jgi:acyl-CoA synthetase (AMP-forming)/AMP-acid ligase II
MDLELLLSMAVSFDESRVAVTGPDGSSVTTGELDAWARGAASVFGEMGGTQVAFCDTNGLAFPIALFGAVMARMPFVPLNYRLADGQLGQIVGNQDFVVVASPEQGRRLRRLGVDRILEADSFVELAKSTKAVKDVAAIDSDAVALLLYTSGTTAAPKAAILRHRHLASYVIGSVEFGTATEDDAALLSLPPYHIAGVMNLLSNLYMGRRIVYLDSFTSEAWLETVRGQSITHAMTVPTMLARIVSTLGGSVADTPSLRTISYGGAKMPVTVIEQALSVFPSVAFTNAYGLTETSSTISVLGPDLHREALHSTDPVVRARLSSAGLPLPGIEIEIRDEGGGPSASGEPGEIFVRGEQVAGEYLGSRGAEDGWFATRDRGYLDEGGYLFIEGRADDTIIRGGENIAPAEIEDVLMGHDDVRDCAVVGVPDDEWGQRIAAAVVLVQSSSVTPDALRSFARDKLRGSKTPDVIVVLDELPYTDTGKLLRRVVRETLAGDYTSPSAN